jgi:hypothetical protein
MNTIVSSAFNIFKVHPIATSIVLALAFSAILNRLLAVRAERRSPPMGSFLNVNGVRLHYVERGAGPPLVLLHGNGSMVEDFQVSGLLELAAKNIGSSHSIDRGLVIATGRAARFGHHKRRPSSSSRL